MWIVRQGVVCALGLSLAVSLSTPAARACGGCFHEPPSTTAVERPSVVTDHRMVLALSATETTLWDQIRWAGNPDDFVWALPLTNVLRARIAIADDDFLNGLDRATAPAIKAEFPSRCVRDPVTGANVTSGPVTREEVQLAVRPIVRSADPDAPVDGGPSVIPEATVGPYQTVLLDGRSRGQHLDEWLPANGYAIPEGGRAAVAHYTALNAGWVVLRLRPGEGVSRMSPVRIALDGYQPTLPLRMIASGAGDSVGIALLVASNGAMRETGLPESRIDPSALTWAAGAPMSNYGNLFQQSLGLISRPSWVTESVVRWSPSTAPSSDARAVLNAGGVITRLRTIATPAALDRDLRLEPSETAPFGPTFIARALSSTTCPIINGGSDGGVDAGPPIIDLPPMTGCQCATSTPRSGGGLAAFALGLAAVLARRLRRR